MHPWIRYWYGNGFIDSILRVDQRFSVCARGFQKIYPKKAILDISGGTACYLQTIIQYVNAQGKFISQLFDGFLFDGS